MPGSKPAWLKPGACRCWWSLLVPAAAAAAVTRPAGVVLVAAVGAATVVGLGCGAGRAGCRRRRCLEGLRWPVPAAVVAAVAP